MVHVDDETADIDLGLKLLLDLTLDGLLGRLALFDLAAGELPTTLHVAIPALGGEDPPVPLDDRRHYLD
jgi:hypothetical protein